MLVLMLGWQVPGLVTRAFLDLLSGSQPARFGIWGILALVVGSAVARIVGIFGLIRTNVPFMYMLHTLLQKNMLTQIFRLPGARALPEAPGEAISRFREDVNEIPMFGLWMNDLLGAGVFTMVAIAIMLSINPFITVVAVVPLVGVVAIARSRQHGASKGCARPAATPPATSPALSARSSARCRRSRSPAPSRTWSNTSDRSTKLVAAPRCATGSTRKCLSSIFWNTGNLGTGLILLLAAQSMRAGAFTVGDFALFTYYLWFISEFTGLLGFMLARYKQAGVAIDRMTRLLGKQPTQTLVEPGPIYSSGELAPVAYHAKTATDRLERLEAQGLAFAYPDGGRGIAGCRACSLTPRIVYRGHRSHRLRQNHAAAGAARPAAARCRRDPLERRSRGRPGIGAGAAALLPIPLRCRVCSAPRCARTCCSACPRTR